MPTIDGDRVFIVQARLRVLRHAAVKTPPHLCYCAAVVFEQFILHRQSPVHQLAHRRIAHQRSKPAVESAYLYWPVGRQKKLVQATQTGKLLGADIGPQAPVAQGLQQLRITGLAEFLDPCGQALAHLTSGFFGKSNGQQFMRLRTFEQCAQHARDQHPGLAGAGAGFNHHAAPRVAGYAVKIRLRYAAPAVGVSRIGLANVIGTRRQLDVPRQASVCVVHAAAQKSLRHSPRTLQKSQVVPSPSAGNTAPSAMRSISESMPCTKASLAWSKSACARVLQPSRS